MAGHFRVAVRGRKARAAGSLAGDHPRRRRHAAAAAPGRRGAGADDDRLRQADLRRRREGARHRRRGRGRPAARRAGVCRRPHRPRRARRGAPRSSRTDWARRRPTRRCMRRRGALAKKTRPHQMAPLMAIEAVEAATTLPFAEGSDRETALFRDCVQSEPAKALIHVFFAERAANKVRGGGGAWGRRGGGAWRRGPRRHRRRGHDGRRHRDGLRERGARRAASRQQPGAAGPGPGDHPAQLRGVGDARPLHRGRRGRAARRASIRSWTRRASTRWTWSSRRCSRTSR